MRKKNNNQEEKKVEFLFLYLDFYFIFYRLYHQLLLLLFTCFKCIEKVRHKASLFCFFYLNNFFKSDCDVTFIVQVSISFSLRQVSRYYIFQFSFLNFFIISQTAIAAPSWLLSYLETVDALFFTWFSPFIIAIEWGYSVSISTSLSASPTTII